MADDKKAFLLRYFNYGVIAYMVSWFAATLLPLFLYSPGQEDTAVQVMLMLENLARCVFLAVLCWVFRSAPFSRPLSPSFFRIVLLGEWALPLSWMTFTRFLAHVVSASIHLPWTCGGVPGFLWT